MKNCLLHNINEKLRLVILTGIVLAFGVMASAAKSPGDKVAISIQFENASIKKVLKAIERQSAYSFVYNDRQVDVTRKISIAYTGNSVEKAVRSVLYDTGIAYKILDDKIVLTRQRSRSMQQNNTVEGQVTDASTGEPLPGVNIKVKTTGKGTISDVNGNYTIEIPTKIEAPVLVFSFVGYKPREVAVEGRSTIDVQLSEDVKSLDEVVVIGYGESSRKLLTSSISSINSEEVEKTLANGVQEALQGKTSGVRITQNSGTPGAAITVNVRGISSISAGTQPLYVVDGVPITTGDYGQISFEGQEIDAVADLNPNNIESISVLKDASAAAIYGARAGNGVILIETKSGSKGETRINFKSFYGMQEVYKKLDMLNAEEWKEYVNTFDPEFVEGLNPNIDTDWQDEVLRNAPIANYELSLSGGNDKTRFFTSGRYFSQKGVVLGSAYEKINGRVNIDHDISKNLHLGARITTTYSVNDRVVGDQTINGVLPNAISKPPVYAVKDSLGNYLEQGFWDNPVAIGNEVVNKAKTFRNISNVFAEWDIISGLTLKNQWGVDVYNLQERRYEPTTVDRGAENNGIGISARTNVLKVTQQTTLKYLKSFGNHKLNMLLGYSFETLDEASNFIRGNNFPSDDLEYLDASGNIENAYSSAYNSGLQSFFGRLKYNYDNKYLLSMSLRRDGSSNFGENNKYAVLPSVSLAYRLAQEPFMSNLGFLNELKLKLSYGLTGNDKIGAFNSLNLYSAGYNYYGSSGIIPTQIPNPDLKWETTANYNAGFDIAVFDSRVTLSGDFYYNKTTDLLLNRPLPGSSGFTSVSANVGALENRGMEYSLTTENFTGPFSWTSSFNISFNRNEILDMYENQPITDVGRGSNSAIVGEAIGAFYMYKSLGVDPSTGDLVFDDYNNDGRITDDDRQVVGNPNPEFTGGFTNELSYKGFDLSVFLQFTYGNDIFNGTRQYAEAMKFGTSDNQLATIKDRWREPGDITYVPRRNGKYNLFPLSSHYIEDGSYLRVKNVTLGYTVPDKLLDQTQVARSVRVFLKVQNLYTLTNYSGMDPEVNYSGVGSLRQGTDFFTYPNVRTYSAGLRIQF